jgi:sugar lactone lactonase YvrE
MRSIRVLTLALVLTGAAVVYAALPTFWQVSTEAEFLRGEVENLSVDSYGRLTLGPTSTPIYESNAPFLWTVVAAPDGAVYAGSGNEGQVYRIDASGKGGLFFDTEELEVHAIVPAPGGGIFVATSPNGRIYKVDASGKGAVFFDPTDRYIWSLAVDREGNVFAATGDKGIIYKITPTGSGSVFYETKATHAMSLAFDRDGRLLAGTDSPGRVFRIDAAGKPFVILDSSYNEIRTLRVDSSGMIYAAAVSGRTGSSSSTPAASASSEPAAPQPIVTVSAEVTAIAVGDVAVGGSGQSSPPPAPRNVGPVTGAVFRIAPDGAWDVIWESREDTPYDIAFEPNGTLLVATGNEGKIYRLSGDPYQPTLVVRANAEQVTTILPEKDGRMLFTTSNPGKVLRLSAARAERGTYISDVRDAQTVAAWGTIRWRAQTPNRTRVELSTRSGNTRTPDETWSEWTPAYQNAEGSAISSPRARYLQWRAVLAGAGGESPLLTSVSAAYLPRNMRPRVTAITVHPPGTVFQRPFPTDPEIAGFDGEIPDRRNASPGSAPTLGRRTYQKGLLTFVWRGEDDNRDELTYDVFYRREGETTWKVLKRSVADPILVWDTTSVPNGSYLLRVVASDAPSNSPTTALTGAMESTSFEIDNAPPQVTIASVRREGGRLTIVFDVRDDHSSVQKADYSLDGDRWQTIYPKDGIADSRVEQFELVLEGEAAARGVIIRAADALNNVASARGEAPAPTSGGR